MALPVRRARLVLIDGDRELVGMLPPFETDVPWWQEASDVVRRAGERHGVEVVVLRLLTTELPAMPGGEVTYLAEVDTGTARRLRGAVAPVDEPTATLALGRDPDRAPYAEVGGPAVSLAWAAAELGGLARAEQQRTWNLSSLWRLTSADGRAVWLKQVPGFFRHEPVALSWLARRVPEAAPPLLAAGPLGRQLLGHVEGTDLYDADGATRAVIARQAHAIQRASTTEVDELAAAGIPDRRGALLVDWIRTTLAGRVGAHPASVLLDRLGETMDELDACGFPPVLVHGDEHGGNVIDTGERLVVVDWGDSFVGHPVFDVLTLARSADGEDAAVLDVWCALWRASVPGCDPERALEVGRSVAALRSAAVYAAFLDAIEVSEAPYHRADVPEWLDRAASLDGD